MCDRCTSLDTREIITRPSENSAVKTTPITVSSLTRERDWMKPMALTLIRPNTNAPITNGRFSRYARTTPGSTACDTASPIRDQPLRVMKHDRTAQTAPTSEETSRARSMKSYPRGASSGVSRASISGPPGRARECGPGRVAGSGPRR